MIEKKRSGKTYLFPDGTTEEQVERYFARLGRERPAPADRAGNREYLKGLGRAAAQGATLSFGDEALAALRFRLGGEDYEAALADERAKLARFGHENPTTALAAELAAGVLPALAVPGGFVAAPARALATVGRLAGVGALYGGASGLGAGEGALTERLPEAAEGAAKGAALGLGIPAVVKAARRLYDFTALRIWPRLADQVGRGRDAVLKALGRDKLTLPELRARVARDQRLGVPGKVLDAGDDLAGLAETVAQHPGTGPAAMTRELAARNADQRERVVEQLTSRVAGRNYYEMEGTLIEGLRVKAAPLYAEAYAAGPEVMTPGLRRVLARLEAAGDFSGAIGAARRIAAREGRRLGPTDAELTAAAREVGVAGPVARGFSTETWDQIKRGLDAMLDGPRYRNELTGRLNREGASVYGLKRQLVNELDVANPAYGVARAEYAGDAETLEALRYGIKEALRAPPETLAAKVAGSSRSEVEALRVGMVRGLQDAMLGPSANFDAAKRVVNSPYMRERLKVLFDDPDEYDLLTAALDREMKMFGDASRIVGNSRTARRIFGKQDLEQTPQAADMITDAVVSGTMGNPRPGLVMAHVMRFLSDRGPMPEEKLNEIARILRAGTDAEVAGVIADLSAHVDRAAATAAGRRVVAARAAGAAGAAVGPEPEIDVTAPPEEEEFAGGGAVKKGLAAALERIAGWAERAPKTSDYPILATGDVATGDTVKFEEAVFGGSFRNPKFLGTRTIEADVISDSYGADKQQHTFTLQIRNSSGLDPFEEGEIVRRKGRNVYRNGVYRQEWTDEGSRGVALDEKHERGEAAKEMRQLRKETEEPKFAEGGFVDGDFDPPLILRDVTPRRYAGGGPPDPGTGSAMRTRLARLRGA